MVNKQGYLSATALDLFSLFLLWPHSPQHSSGHSLTSDPFDSVSPFWPRPQPLGHVTKPTLQLAFQDSQKGRVSLCPLVVPVLATLGLAPAPDPVPSQVSLDVVGRTIGDPPRTESPT